MNPTPKPADTRLRVLHGGSWGNNEPSWVRAASRSAYLPAYRINVIGFRCALRGRQPQT